jgi:hypothetical protein
MIDTLNKNNLSNDVVIKGSIKFANEFIFEGNLEGDITSADRILTVGENTTENVLKGETPSKIRDRQSPNFVQRDNLPATQDPGSRISCLGTAGPS